MLTNRWPYWNRTSPKLRPYPNRMLTNRWPYLNRRLRSGDFPRAKTGRLPVTCFKAPKPVGLTRATQGGSADYPGSVLVNHRWSVITINITANLPLRRSWTRERPSAASAGKGASSRSRRGKVHRTAARRHRNDRGWARCAAAPCRTAARRHRSARGWARCVATRRYIVSGRKYEWPPLHIILLSNLSFCLLDKLYDHIHMH